MFWSSIFATAMFPVVVVALLLAHDWRKRRLGEKRALPPGASRIERHGVASSHRNSRTAA
jgi:hypothetical protein